MIQPIKQHTYKATATYIHVKISESADFQCIL